MANELRKRQLSIGGLVEDSPLTSGATAMNSAGLAAITSGVASTEHMAIVLDPDGSSGAPEVAYLLDVTAGVGATGASGLGRGMEGTTARAHVAGTPWVHAPTMRDIVRQSARKQRASTDISLNSATWADVDTALDLVLPAFAGDIIEYGISGYIGAGGTADARFDVATVVSSSPVNYLSNGTATPPANAGVPGWFCLTATLLPVTGSIVGPALVSGDLSGGTVTLRLRYMQSAASARSLNATANAPLTVWAKNLGPASATT